MEKAYSLLLLVVCCTIVTPQESEIKAEKLQAPRSAFIKSARPKNLKRSPGYLPINTKPRILNNKAPLNLLQHGPYYINHYIYCDNLDQHALDQIKAGGGFSPEKELQFLKDKLHHHFDGGKPLESFESGDLNGFKTTSFIGDKELHILHLPKDKEFDFKDVKLHLQLAGAHQTPEVDLDLNKNVDSFEINLGTIQPPKLLLHSSFPTKSSLEEVVTPLIQGQVTTRPSHKYSLNHLHQLTHFLNQNGGGDHSKLALPARSETNGKGEFVDLPNLDKHPLEHDPSKSSYDSPGAVDSYGHPVTDSYIKGGQDFFTKFSKGAYGYPVASLDSFKAFNQGGKYTNTFQELGNNGLNSNGFKMENYFFSEQFDLQRKRQQGLKAASDQKKYPNHKYD